MSKYQVLFHEATVKNGGVEKDVVTEIVMGKIYDFLQFPGSRITYTTFQVLLTTNQSRETMTVEVMIDNDIRHIEVVEGYVFQMPFENSDVLFVLRKICGSKISICTLRQETEIIKLSDE